MPIKLNENAAICSEISLKSDKHILFVLNEDSQKSHVFSDVLQTKLKRSKKTFKDLAKTPVTLDLPNGALASFVVATKNLTVFQRHTILRKAAISLLQEKPASLAICVFGDEELRKINANAAYYVVCVNATPLPAMKKKQEKAYLEVVRICGYANKDGYEETDARVDAYSLCRTLTMLPPNELTPTAYRKKVKDLAKKHGWKHEEFDMSKLNKMGAGAFVAVGQGSEPQDAAIVHLSYTPKNPKKHISLVGKGICFDTGGHNLKPAKYMQNMHEDMNGSAVALSIFLAATKLKMPIKLDCWLAIAQNHIGPRAYKQNDVVKALNGMTIEIVHTDAEGRMVLADTLTLASRAKPDVILDYATLTGAMAVAVTERMSGIISNRPELACKAIGAGAAAGERIVSFPYEEDMDSDLDSDIADIKQCTLEGGGDHMLAARFMGKFIENDVPWVHADLSSTNYKGGLGAVQSTVNGFGVGFGFEMIKSLLAT